MKKLLLLALLLGVIIFTVWLRTRREKLVRRNTKRPPPRGDLPPGTRGG